MNYLRSKKNIQILENQENINRFKEKELKVSCYKNSTIVPYKGCFNEQKDFIDGTWLHEITTFNYDEKNNDSVQHIKKAVYLGCFVNIWGHCITDGIKRLWYFYSQDFNNENDIEYVYIKVNTLPLPENYLKLLSYLMPQNIKIIEIQAITKVDELYIPDVSFYSDITDGKVFFKEYLFILDLLKQKYKKPDNLKTYDKIYLSRTSLKSHIEYGEKYIEKVFETAGFKIIHPQNYTLEEQLSLYESCKYFAALEGSGAHNSIFCKQGTNVYILRKSDFINSYQIAIDKIANTHTVYIDSNFSVMNSKSKPWTGPFFLYVNKCLSLFFMNEFNLKIKRYFPLLLFLKYIFVSFLDKFLNILKLIYHSVRR